MVVTDRFHCSLQNGWRVLANYRDTFRCERHSNRSTTIHLRQHHIGYTECNRACCPGHWHHSPLFCPIFEPSKCNSLEYRVPVNLLRGCSIFKWVAKWTHYNDVIMSAMVAEITSLTIVQSSVYSGADQIKTSKISFTGLCEGISPVTGEFPAQRPVTRK